jgi:hypothetical protein
MVKADPPVHTPNPKPGCMHLEAPSTIHDIYHQTPHRLVALTCLKLPPSAKATPSRSNRSDLLVASSSVIICPCTTRCIRNGSSPDALPPPPPPPSSSSSSPSNAAAAPSHLLCVGECVTSCRREMENQQLVETDSRTRGVLAGVYCEGQKRTKTYPSIRRRRWLDRSVNLRALPSRFAAADMG